MHCNSFWGELTKWLILSIFNPVLTLYFDSLAQFALLLVVQSLLVVLGFVVDALILSFALKVGVPLDFNLVAKLSLLLVSQVILVVLGLRIVKPLRPCFVIVAILLVGPTQALGVIRANTLPAIVVGLESTLVLELFPYRLWPLIALWVRERLRPPLWFTDTRD